MSSLSRRILLASPLTLTTTTISDTRVDVAWSAVFGAVSYRVYRDDVLTDSPTTEGVSATNLTGGTQYLFQVAAIDSAGHEGPKTLAMRGVTFATPDTTPPTAPTIGMGAVTTSSVIVQLLGAAIDSGSGLATYTLQRSTNSGFTQGLVTTDLLLAASFPLTVGNLSSGTQYWFRLRGVDAAGNVGLFGAAVNVTTTVAQGGTSFWPAWPMMNTTCLQGDVTKNLLDSTKHALLADKCLVIITNFGETPARILTRKQNIQAVRAIRGQGRPPRFALYTGVQQTLKVWPQDSGLDINAQIIASATEGNPNWYVHRVGDTGKPSAQWQTVEPNFGQADNRQINMAVLKSGLNSLGENYVQALWRNRRVLLADLMADLDGFFQDNFNARPPDMWVNSGASQVTDLDYNNDGIADTRADFTGGSRAAGSWWADGHLESLAQMQAQFPGFLMIPNFGQAAVDYFDGDGDPPIPLSQHPFYQKFDCGLYESVYLALGIAHDATGYTFAPGAVSTFLRNTYIVERFLRPDAQNTISGKGCILVHATCVNRTTPNSDDFTYARFITALAMLSERMAPCVQQTSSLPLSLDETLLDFGAPVATRTMGTLNEAAAGGPTFTIRTADFSSGVARFYWAKFGKVLVLVRTDVPTTGVYPSADAAVACTLPAPPAGKKYQHFNAATYFNTNTGRSTRGQDTTLNNGADVGLSVSLKPYTAVFLLIV